MKLQLSLLPLFVLICTMGVPLTGCSTNEAVDSQTTQSAAPQDESESQPESGEAELAGSAEEAEPLATADEPTASVSPLFEAPVRLRAGGEIVAVEEPGYACPTMADVDGDGKEDLVVGQFSSGHMQFCKNIAGKNEAPKFAKAEWLKTGDQRAEVPGVW